MGILVSDDLDLPWEQTNRVDELREAAGFSEQLPLVNP